MHRSPGRGRGFARACARLANIALAVHFCDPAAAQMRPQPARPRGNVQIVQGEPPRELNFEPARDRDAEAWLSKAAAAAREGQWKLFVDTLHRVVRDHAGSIVAADAAARSDETTLMDATAAAWRALAQADAAALEAYRLTYEGEAAEALGDAAATGDELRLRRVVRMYRATSSGATAADALASRMIDAGRWSEAIQALDALDQFPSQIAPRWSILLRRATASAMRGRPEQAGTALDELWRTKDENSPDDLTRKIKWVRDLIARPELLALPHESREWPALLGAAADGGRMAEIDAQAVRQAPLRLPLPAAADILRPRALIEAYSQSRAPVWQIATDGERLFVATPAGFAALNPATLEPIRPPTQSALKSSREEPVSPAGLNQSRLSALPRDALNVATGRSVYDETAGAISVCDGVVFLIEQPAPYGNNGRISAEAFNDLMENSLSAYDARNGKLLWTKGRGGPPADGLAGAHFFSLPVRAGRFWVTLYQAGSEMALLALEADGSIAGSVPLGTGGESGFPAARLLPLVVADDEIYVVSGMGRVFALAVSDFSLRWSATYERNTRQRFAEVAFGAGRAGALEPIADSWCATPPLVCGDLLIAAPVDADQLLALDRADGRLRWRAPRGRLRYLIGADDQRVYAFGRDVAAFALRTGGATPGGPIWNCEGPGVAGRPALCGGQLLIPTNAGLVTLDAVTGRRLSVFEEPSLGALGNLFAWNGALYSTEHDAIRRFTDPTAERRRAEQALADAPGDLRRRANVARLQLRSGNADAAAATLEAAPAADVAAIDPSDSETDDDAIGELTDVRVDVNLALARQAPLDAENEPRVARWLDQAAELARRSEQRFAVARARAARAMDNDRPTEAAAALINALTDGLPAAVAADARRLLSGELAWTEDWRRISSRLSETERQAALQALGGLIERTTDTNARTAMDRLLSAVSPAAPSSESEMSAAAEALSAGRLESATYHYRRAARRADSQAAKTVALAALIDARCDAPIRAAPAAIAADIDALEALGGALDLPADAQGAARGTIADFTARHRAALLARPSPADSPAAQSGSARLRPRAATRLQDVALGLAGTPLDGRGRPLLAFPIVICRDSLFGLDALPDEKDIVAFRTAIQTEEPVIEDASLRDAGETAVGAGQVAVALAGDIAAISTAGGVEFVGLLTAQRVTAPLYYSPESRAELPTQPVVAADDLFAVMVNRNTLVGLAAQYDAKPLWRLTLDTDVVTTLSAAEGVLIATAPGLTRVWVIDPANGRIRRIDELRRDDPAIDQWPAVTARRCAALVGAFSVSSERGRIRVRHVPSGELVWQTDAGDDVIHLQPVDSDYVGVSQQDAFTVYHIRTGASLGRIEAEGLPLPPTDATLTAGGGLILLHRGAPQSPSVELTWCQLDTGRRVQTLGPWPLATLTPRMFRHSPGLLPVVRYDSELSPDLADPAHQGQPAFSGVSTLHLFDKVSARRVGAPLRLSGGVFPPQSGANFVQDVDILGDRVRVLTPHDVRIVQIEEAP